MMKTAFFSIVRGFVSLGVGFATWMTAFVGFDETFWMSSGWALLGTVSSYMLLKWRAEHKLLKQNGITRKEYRYIKQNLKEAHDKIRRLNKTLFASRSIHAAWQIGKLQRTVSRIYQVVKEEPKRFFQAEKFFFYHLDSIVELSERYTFLTRQKIKDHDVRLSLSETEQTLKTLTASVEEDLRVVVANDIDTLQMELDVAKLTLGRDEKVLIEERRKIDE